MDREKPLDIYVSCGEASGDHLGYEVLKPLAERFRIRGVVGESMKTLPIEPDFHVEDFSINGFVGALASLPSLISNFQNIKQTILDEDPKVVFLIDFPDFHMMLANSLRKHGFQGKIVLLVCPSIWAWRKTRKQSLVDHFDHILCLFDFEKKLFEGEDICAHHVGHPLAEKLTKFREEITADLSEPLISMFPGSRRKEILSNLPLMLEAVAPYQKSHKLAICLVAGKYRPYVEKALVDAGLEAEIVPSEERYKLMKRSTLALAKSGTINLELALMGTPLVSVYKVPFYEEFIARHIFNVVLPHYSIVNILAKQRIIPEYIAPLARAPLISAEVNTFLENPERLQSQKEALVKIQEDLHPSKVEKKGSEILEGILLP